MSSNEIGQSGNRLLRVSVSNAGQVSLMWVPVDKYTAKAMWYGSRKRKRYFPTVAFVETEEQAQQFLVAYYQRQISNLTCQIADDVYRLQRLNALLGGVSSGLDLGAVIECDESWQPTASGTVS